MKKNQTKSTALSKVVSKVLLSLLFLCVLTGTSCEGSGGGGGLSPEASIVGKFIHLYRSDGQKLLIEHLNAHAASIANQTYISYKDGYAPEYEYVRSGNKAMYSLMWTPLTYVPSTEGTSAGLIELDKNYMELQLTFTSDDRGTFTGTMWNEGWNPNTYESYKKNETPCSGTFYLGQKNDPNPNDGVDDNTNNPPVDPPGGGEDSTNYPPVIPPSVTEYDAITPDVWGVEYHKYSNSHIIWLRYGNYKVAPKKESSLLSVGYCAGTEPDPTVGDITIPQSVQRTEKDYIFSIPEARYTDHTIEGGTLYYIRPYSINGTTVTYYKGTSVETIGNNVKISDKGSKISYHFNDDATYKYTVTYRAIPSKNYTKDEGFAYGEGSLTIELSLAQYGYEECLITFQNMDTGIYYRYTLPIE